MTELFSADERRLLRGVFETTSGSPTEVILAVATRAVELKATGGFQLPPRLRILIENCEGAAKEPGQTVSVENLLELADFSAAQGARVAALEDEVQRLSGLSAVTECMAARRERDEAYALAATYKRDIDAESAGSMALRKRFGADDTETFQDFVARLSKERDVAAQLALLRLKDRMALAAERDETVSRLSSLRPFISQLATLSVEMAKVVGDPSAPSCCEHCGNDAPNGKRFCSARCQKCESTDWPADGCASVCKSRYPCSTTCTHDDAATPGHAERVKERSEAFNGVRAGPLTLNEREQSLFEAAWDGGQEQGAEAMRAACLVAVRDTLQGFGDERLYPMLKAAIEGATP